MRGFSKVIIAGNLTRDPELRTTASGSTVCSFSVAVNRSYRDASGESKEQVSFFNCSAWGKQGETINQYAKKGSGILLSGRLEQRSWEDKEGQKRSTVEITVDDFNFVGGRGESEAGGQGSSASSSSDTSSPSPLDDIPDGEISVDEVPF